MEFLSFLKSPERMMAIAAVVIWLISIAQAAALSLV